MDVTLHAFDGRSGAHLCRLRYTALSWSDEINSEGSLSATLVRPPERALRPWATILAAVSGSRVLHAGYLTHARLSRADGTWEADCGGGATVLGMRLVLNRRLAASWRDGEVLVDEEHPAGDWPLTLRGSYSDIISGLISETLAWGELPIVPAPPTGGDRERTYNSYDLAPVLQRIEELGEVEAGPEWRLDPELDPGWNLSFRQVASADGGELVDHAWRWNALAPGSGVTLGDEDREEADMCTDAYLAGGRDEDRLLVARSRGSALTGAGWPVLQVADRTHSTVSVLATLRSHAAALVAAGDATQDTLAVLADASRYDVRVGDHADVRHGTGERDVAPLKVVGVSHTAGEGTLALSCRRRDA